MKFFSKFFTVLLLNLGLFVFPPANWASDIEIDLGGGGASNTPKMTPNPSGITAEVQTEKQNQKVTTAPKTALTETNNNEGGARHPAELDQIEVSPEGVGAKVLVTGVDLPQPSVSKISGNRILLKLKKTVLKIPSKIKVTNKFVKSIRSSKHPGGAWVVLDVKNAKKWSTEKTSDGFALLLNLTQTLSEPAQNSETAGSANSVSQSGEKGLFSQLVDASLKPTENGVKLVLTADGPSKYTVRKLSQPEKIIIHFHETKLSMAEKARNFKNDDPALQKGGLLSLEFRQIGPLFSPISEAMLTVLPGTVYQIDRDLNQVIVTLTSPAVVQKQVEKKGNLNQLITMDLQSADLNTVVKTLADESGYELNLPAGPVSGTANEKFKDVPLKTVLADLLAPVGYNFEVQGNTLRVGPQAVLTATKILLPHITELIAPSGGMTPQQFDGFVRPLLSPSNASMSQFDTVRNMIILTGTVADIEDYKRAIRDLKLDSSSSSSRISRVVKLNYADPNKLMTILGPYLTPVGKIQVSDFNLVIWETATNMGTLLELINELDRKPPQVLIESNIVEVDNESDLNLGVQWTLNKNSGDPTVTGLTTGSTASNYGTITFGTIKAGININATLQALETHNKAKVISRPRIATTNGVLAEINEIENVVYSSVQTTITNGLETQQVTFQQLPLPIDLQVTPRITDEGIITSQIAVSITAQTGSAIAVAGSISPPPTNVQFAKTSINTKNGESIVIGGLVRETVQDNVTGIPILKDLPIIGTLFQAKQRTNKKEELVIFITPTLLED